MLCTHLLTEAEELCDAISIMLKGSIYVVGTPSALAAKFGTEWRLDVLFSTPTHGQFYNFLRSQIPSTRIVIHRPSNQILMDTVIANPEFGVRFFTVSSATLEKVFMELALQSEAIQQAAHPENAEEH
jgi:ABC-type multidrug transport system ATPase subunit